MCLFFKVVCPVRLCPWQVRGGLSGEVLQQPAWYPLRPQIHHISIWSAQVNIQLLHPWRTTWTRAQLDICFFFFFCCGRFVQYKATSLEKQHKHELLTEPDLGVTIDLINPDTYRIDPNSKSPVVVTCHILFIFVRDYPALSNVCVDWTHLLNCQYCWIPLMRNCWKRTSRLHPVRRGKAAK